MRRRGGLGGTLISILTTLVVIGLILAVLTQFDGNLGEMVRWVLNAAWSVITNVRDTVLGWDTFQGLF